MPFLSDTLLGAVHRVAASIRTSPRCMASQALISMSTPSRRCTRSASRRR
jgi:hypothetical protein